jgi:hypothetical protein
MQPYPTSTQMPQPGTPPVPPSVANAVKAMYAGAAVTVVGVVIEILNASATKAAIQKRSPHMSASQVASTQHALVIGAIVGGLIAIAAWIFLARACRNGNAWARTTGTVFFALATVDTIGSAVAPVAVAVKAFWPVIWLAGLTAVIFLWQRASTAFFKGTSE